MADSESESDVTWLAYLLDYQWYCTYHANKDKLHTSSQSGYQLNQNPMTENKQTACVIRICIRIMDGIRILRTVGVIWCATLTSLYRPVDSQNTIIQSWLCLFRLFDFIIMDSLLDNPGVALAGIITNVSVFFELWLNEADDGTSQQVWDLSQ